MRMRKAVWVIVVTACLLAALACSLPQPPTVSTAETASATSPPTEEAPASPAPTTAEPPLEPLAVIHQGSVFLLAALDGTPSGSLPAAGLDWARPGRVQVVGDAVYYVDSGGSGLGGVARKVTAGGTTELPFTLAEPMAVLTFAVSPDETRIAWAYARWDESGNHSELWAANLDGSAAQLVAAASPSDELEDYYVLEPVTWLTDGSLIYAWQISGIGGYILFFGYSSLYRYDTVSGATTPLAPVGPTAGAPCWSSLSPDGAFAVGACAPDHSMMERNLGSGVSTIFPAFPDQGQAGAGAYSPSGSRLAYAIARGNPDDEAGQVIVRLHPDEPPVAIASQGEGYFDTLLWVDEDRLVVGYWQGDAGSVDLLRLDGTRTPIGSGQVVGLMWPD